MIKRFKFFHIFTIATTNQEKMEVTISEDLVIVRFKEFLKSKEDKKRNHLVRIYILYNFKHESGCLDSKKC